MPRDASGNYTLPAGNPVVTGTVITSSWANPTMSDIAQEITNSLSRDGQGGMLAPLQFADGTVNDPSVAFTQEPTLGFYRKGAGLFSIAGQGKDIAVFDASTGQMTLGSGSKAGITIQPDVDIDFGVINFKNAAGAILGQVFLGLPDGKLHLTRYDDTVTLLTRLELETDGNVSVSGDGAVPTIAANLTRKDYVDALSTGSQSNGTYGHPPTADLNDITINSIYLVPSPVINGPSNYNAGSRGFIQTLMTNNSTTLGCQVLWGRTTANEYKMWMRPFNVSFEAWKLVVDGGAFTQRLAGYDDNQRHAAFEGDLDTIVINSKYQINGSLVTNEPTDMGGSNGFLVTDIISTSTSTGTQVIYGSSITAPWKQWMRSREGSAWGVWKLVVDGSSLEFDANGQALLANAPTEDAAATRKDYVDSKTFPAGTRMLFVQTAAPTGWTKLVDLDNRCLRIVAGNVTVAGSVPFTTLFGRTAVDSHILTEAQMPSHFHQFNYYGGGHSGGSNAGVCSNEGGASYIDGTGVAGPLIGARGGDGGHSHNIDMRVQYADVIYAEKDA